MLGIVGAARAGTITWTLHNVETEGGASVTGSFDVLYDPAGPVPYMQITNVDITVGPGLVRDSSGSFDVLDGGYHFTALNYALADVNGGSFNQSSLLAIDFCTGVGCNNNQQIVGLGFADPGLGAAGGTFDLAYDYRLLGGGYGPPLAYIVPPAVFLQTARASPPVMLRELRRTREPRPRSPHAGLFSLPASSRGASR